MTLARRGRGLGRLAIASLLLVGGCGDDPDLLGREALEVTTTIDEALAMAKNGDYEAAVDALRPHVSVARPETQALTLYGSSLMASRRASLAIWAFGRGAERPDAPPNVRLAYLRSLIRGGDSLAAVDAATRYLEASPDDQTLLDLRAQAYDSAMQYENALADLEAVSDENPGTPILVERLLNLYIKIEDWDAARERIAELESLLARPGVDPDSRTIFCATAARFEHERGEVETAEAKILECLEESPGEPNLVFTRIALLDERNRVDEATSWLAELVERYPKRQALAHGLADRLASLGRYDEAEATLLAAAEAVPSEATWLALANLRLATDDVEGAAEALDLAIELLLGESPSDPELDWTRVLAESRFGIGEVYVRTGQLDRANRIIDSLAEEPAMAKLLRARIKLEQGDPRGALDDYQEAFKTFPSNAAARYLAGRAAVAVGEYDLALEMYQDALRADPMGTDAGFVLAQMLAAEGRYSWALDAVSFRSARAPDGDPTALRMLARLGSAAGLHQYAESVRATLSNSAVWVGVALSDQARDIEVIAGPDAAIRYLDAVEELEEPAHYEAFSAWYRLAVQLNREDEARERLAAWGRAHPEAAGVRIVQGRAHAEDGALEAARDAYASAIDLDDASAVAHFEYGQVLAQLGDTDAAVHAFDRAAEIDDVDGRAAFAAAQTLYEAGRVDESVERLRSLMISFPFHGMGALLLVDIAREDIAREDSAREQNRLVGEEEAYAMARQANRYHMHAGPRAHLEFGAMALKRDEFEPALAAYDLAIKKRFDLGNALLGHARALEGLGRVPAAIADLEAAVSMEDFESIAAAEELLEALRAQMQEGQS